MSRRPCTECPWRIDTPRGQFPAERYTALRTTTGRPGAEAPWDAPWFGCHKAPDDGLSDFVCAGWLAAVGLEHLGVRIAAGSGRLDPEALRPGPDWPELHSSYESLEAVHGER